MLCNSGEKKRNFLILFGAVFILYLFLRPQFLWKEKPQKTLSKCPDVEFQFDPKCELCNVVKTQQILQFCSNIHITQIPKTIPEQLRFFAQPRLSRPISKQFFINRQSYNFCLKPHYRTGYTCSQKVNDTGGYYYTQYESCNGLSHGYLWRIRNALVLNGGHFVVHDSEHKRHVILNANCPTMDGTNFPGMAPQIKRVKSISKPDVILLYHGHGHHYYHFIVENMVQLFQLPNFKSVIADPNVHFIVPKAQSVQAVSGKPTNFVHRLMNFIGVSSDRLIEADPAVALNVKSLVFLSSPDCAHTFPEPMQRMQDFFWNQTQNLAVNNGTEEKNQTTSKCNETARADDRYTLITVRKHVKSVSNHQKLMTKLRDRYPCEVFKEFGEKETTERMAQLFSKAKIVIGPHGAGLTNMLFSEPNGEKRKVAIEFHIAHADTWYLYPKIAHTAGFQHYFGLMTGAPGGGAIRFHVNIEETLKTYDIALKYVNQGTDVGSSATEQEGYTSMQGKCS